MRGRVERRATSAQLADIDASELEMDQPPRRRGGPDCGDILAHRDQITDDSGLPGPYCDGHAVLRERCQRRRHRQAERGSPRPRGRHRGLRPSATVRRSRPVQPRPGARRPTRRRRSLSPPRRRCTTDASIRRSSTPGGGLLREVHEQAPPGRRSRRDLLHASLPGAALHRVADAFVRGPAGELGDEVLTRPSVGHVGQS